MKDHQIELLNDMIYKIYSMEDYDEMRGKILSSLSFLIPCYSAVFYLTCRSDKDNRYRLASPACIGVDISIPEKYLADYQSSDKSRWNYYASASDAYNDRAFLEEDEKSNDPLYLHIHKPLRIKYQISLTIICDGVFYGVIALQRQDTDSDFTAEDLWTLKLLAPHLSYRAKREAKAAPAFSRNSNSSLPSYDTLLDQYHLTLREIDVVYEMLQGHGKQEICDKLFISPNTLKKHTVNIYKKLGINSWRELYKLLNQENA